MGVGKGVRGYEILGGNKDMGRALGASLTALLPGEHAASHHEGRKWRCVADHATDDIKFGGKAVDKLKNKAFFANFVPNIA